MPMMEKVKEHPLKVFLASSGSIIALVGAMFALDSRYAHAADVEKDKQQVQRIILETSQTLRQQMLEDKLFELDAKRAQIPNGKLPPVDEALSSRYKRQLEEISRRKVNP